MKLKYRDTSDGSLSHFFPNSLLTRISLFFLGVLYFFHAVYEEKIWFAPPSGLPPSSPVNPGSAIRLGHEKGNYTEQLEKMPIDCSQFFFNLCCVEFGSVLWNCCSENAS